MAYKMILQHKTLITNRLRFPVVTLVVTYEFVRRYNTLIYNELQRFVVSSILNVKHIRGKSFFFTSKKP